MSDCVNVDITQSMRKNWLAVRVYELYISLGCHITVTKKREIT